MSIIETTVTKRITNLTAKDVADDLHMHAGSLANWRVKGEGPPFIKVGRKVLYPRDSFEAWKSQRMRRSTTDDGRIY